MTLQESGTIPDQERRAAETSFQVDVRGESVHFRVHSVIRFHSQFLCKINLIPLTIFGGLSLLVTPVPPSVPSGPSIIDITSTSIFTVGGQYSCLRRTSVTPCSLVHTHSITHQLLTVQHHAITIGMVSIA